MSWCKVMFFREPVACSQILYFLFRDCRVCVWKCSLLRAHRFQTNCFNQNFEKYYKQGNIQLHWFLNVLELFTDEGPGPKHLENKTIHFVQFTSSEHFLACPFYGTPFIEMV